MACECTTGFVRRVPPCLLQRPRPPHQQRQHVHHLAHHHFHDHVLYTNNVLSSSTLATLQLQFHFNIHHHGLRVYDGVSPPCASLPTTTTTSTTPPTPARPPHQQRQQPQHVHHTSNVTTSITPTSTLQRHHYNLNFHFNGNTHHIHRNRANIHHNGLRVYDGVCPPCASLSSKMTTSTTAATSSRPSH